MEMQTIITIAGISITIVGFIITLGVYLNKIANNEKKIDKLENKIDDFIIKIYEKLGSIKEDTRNYVVGLLQTKSPISLSEKGKKVADEIKAKDLIERIYSDIIIYVIEDKNNIPSLYDIQESSFKVIKEKLLDLINEQEFKSLKTVAFNEGIEVDDFFPLLGIVFRDMIMTKNNLDIDDLKD